MGVYITFYSSIVVMKYSVSPIPPIREFNDINREECFIKNKNKLRTF